MEPDRLPCLPYYAYATSLAPVGAIMAPLKVPLCYTYKTKGAFEGAEGAIHHMAPSAPSKVPLVLCVLCSAGLHDSFRVS